MKREKILSMIAARSVNTQAILGVRGRVDRKELPLGRDISKKKPQKRLKLSLERKKSGGNITSH